MKYPTFLLALCVLFMSTPMLADKNTMQFGSPAQTDREPRRRSLIPSEQIFETKPKAIPLPKGVKIAGRKGRKMRAAAKRGQKLVDIKIPSIEKMRENRKERVRKKNEQIKKELAQISPKKTRKARKIKERKQRDWSTINTMGLDELRVVKNKMIKQGNKQSAIKFIETMLPLCDDLKEIHDLMLEVADLMFDLGQLQKAEKIYAEFTLLYPGSTNIEYALYKAILCCFYATVGTDRDQTKTRETLELTERFLKKQEVFTAHLEDVKGIARECNLKLAKNELVVAEFYLNKGRPSSLRAAGKRLEFVRKTYLEKAPDVEPYLLALEHKVAHQAGNKQDADDKFIELIEKFPKKGAHILADNKRAQKRLSRKQEREKKQLTLAQADTQKSTDVAQQKKSVKFVNRF